MQKTSIADVRLGSTYASDLHLSMQQLTNYFFLVWKNKELKKQHPNKYDHMHTIYDMIFCYQKKKHTSYVGFLLWALIIATKKPANFMINISIRDQYARSFTSAKSWSNIAFQGCIKHNMDRLQISHLILSKFKQIN